MRRGRLWRRGGLCLGLCLAAAGAEPRAYRLTIKPHWDAGGERFWYRNDGPEGTHDFVRVAAPTGARTAAFDHTRVAALLAEALGRAVDPNRLPVTALAFTEDPHALDLVGSAGTWRLDLDSYRLSEGSAGGPGAGLPFDRRPRPSRRTGPEAFVTFVNRLSEAVQLFWLDTTGARRAYGSLAAGAERRQHTFAGHVWLVTETGGRVLAVFETPDGGGRAVIDGREPPASRPRRRAGPAETVVSPDGSREAFVRDHNLWVRGTEGGRARALSVDGNPNDSYHRDAQRARLVGMDYERADWPASLPDATWSPDGRYLLALQTRAVAERRVTLVESSPRDQLQPKVHTYPYLKPGDAIPVGRPRLFDVNEGREIPLDEGLFTNPWSIDHVSWAPDSSRVTFLYNQRGHQVMRVLAVELPAGTTRAVVDEHCPTFFCYSSKLYLEVLHDTNELIWMSERSGWNHLYRVDLDTGRVLNPITRGNWVVRRVLRLDREARQLIIEAGGLVPGEDPYQRHVCRVNLDGTGLRRLTEGDGDHTVQWSPDRRFLIDTWSRVDLPPIHDLRRAADGALLCRLERADAHELLAAWGRFPERFTAPGRDGITPIYGILHWPRHVDPEGSYALIESIYAGPHGAHVPKGFRTRYSQRALADRGFVVVQIDGMGTNGRSKAFHDVCWQNLVDAGLPDRIAWMRAAAARHACLDLRRVGIYGTSAGGQNALAALLTHGDFYRVGVADCGCHDNRMDKIWWNEQWMGWPVGPHYAAQSNVTLAPRLTGDLLLLLGELDRNVDPASTMQVVDALIRADRDFDLVVIPGAGHGAAGTPYGRRRLQAFFVEHLLHVTNRLEGPGHHDATPDRDPPAAGPVSGGTP